MDHQGLSDYVADFHSRVQRSVRVLKNNLHFRRSSRKSRLPIVVTSRPSKAISPFVGSISRSKQRPAVHFPHPDSPTSPSVSPRKISKDTPSTARSTSRLPSTGKRLTSPRTRTSSCLSFEIETISPGQRSKPLPSDVRKAYGSPCAFVRQLRRPRLRIDQAKPGNNKGELPAGRQSLSAHHAPEPLSRRWLNAVPCAWYSAVAGSYSTHRTTTPSPAG